MISGVILTKNEEGNISECIKGLEFCDEILVVDDYSSDKTRKIAKKLGARVYNRKLNDDFSKQRNYGLEKCKYEWVLFVDADERVGKKLREEIIEKTIPHRVQDDVISGFYVKRVMRWRGVELRHGEWGKTKLLRLGRKNKGSWKRKVHEIWDIKGKIGHLENEIIHENDKNICELVDKNGRWAWRHARANKNEGKKANIIKIIIMPWGKFFVNYVLKNGFRDGIYGFIMAIMMSYHSFLAWSELWLMQKKYKMA